MCTDLCFMSLYAILDRHGHIMTCSERNIDMNKNTCSCQHVHAHGCRCCTFASILANQEDTWSQNTMLCASVFSVGASMRLYIHMFLLLLNIRVYLYFFCLCIYRCVQACMLAHIFVALHLSHVYGFLTLASTSAPMTVWHLLARYAGNVSHFGPAWAHKRTYKSNYTDGVQVYYIYPI